VRLTPKKIVLAAGAGLATLAYVWVGAVRAAPAVRREKRAARARRVLARPEPDGRDETVAGSPAPPPAVSQYIDQIEE
jgi:hypothetical protein